MKHKKHSAAKHSAAKHSAAKHSAAKHSANDITVHLDMTDKSLLDFKKAKSISVASRITDLKSSKISELYEVKPIHDNMQRLCLLKMQAKSSKDIPIPKKVCKDICECLFEKNKELTIDELEKRINARIDTPASQCITILDNYLDKTSNDKSKKSNKSHTITKNKSTRKTTAKKTRKSIRKSSAKKH